MHIRTGSLKSGFQVLQHGELLFAEACVPHYGQWLVAFTELLTCTCFSAASSQSYFKNIRKRDENTQDILRGIPMVENP